MTGLAGDVDVAVRHVDDLVGRVALEVEGADHVGAGLLGAGRQAGQPARGDEQVVVHEGASVYS